MLRTQGEDDFYTGNNIYKNMEEWNQRERENYKQFSVTQNTSGKGSGMRLTMLSGAESWKAFYAVLRNLASILKAIVNHGWGLGSKKDYSSGTLEAGLWVWRERDRINKAGRPLYSPKKEDIGLT